MTRVSEESGSPLFRCEGWKGGNQAQEVTSGKTFGPHLLIPPQAGTEKWENSKRGERPVDKERGKILTGSSVTTPIAQSSEQKRFPFMEKKRGGGGKRGEISPILGEKIVMGEVLADIPQPLKGARKGSRRKRRKNSHTKSIVTILINTVPHTRHLCCLWGHGSSQNGRRKGKNLGPCSRGGHVLIKVMEVKISVSPRRVSPCIMNHYHACWGKRRDTRKNHKKEKIVLPLIHFVDIYPSLL